MGVSMEGKTPITFGEELRSLATPAFRLLETRHAQGMLVPLHEHEHGCVNFVLAGCYREDLARLEGAFAPLTCTYKPPGAPHRNRFTDAPARCLLIELRQADLVAPGTDLGRPATSRRPGPVRAALALWRELAAPDACSPLVAEQLALEVVEDALAEGAGVAERSARVNAARETLHDDPRQPWTLSSLALHVGLHPSHLARAFRARHGCTIGEYLRRLRLNQIALALALGERTISGLVLEQGFADQSHGTRAFRRQFGTTPGAFRRAFRAGGRRAT
jgi:AraC family transcriptional regulator